MFLTIACSECKFALWRPISALSASQLGLYSDIRFPGRSMLSLNDHYDHLDEVPMDTLWKFMVDLKHSIAAIKTATGAPRVNTAILGNQEGHVHAHLIPRQPAMEPRPDKAPWEDTREKGALDDTEERRLIERIQVSLTSIYGVAKPYPVPSSADSQERRLSRERAELSHLTLFGSLWGDSLTFNDELKSLDS